jgi:hypothetical protein
MPELKSLAVGWNRDGRLELVAIATAATAEEDFPLATWRLQQRTIDDLGWEHSGDWQPFGEPAGAAVFASSRIAITSNADGRLEAAMIGGDDGDVWHAWQRRSGEEWTRWSSLGHPPLRMLPPSSPALTRNQDGRLELFLLGDGVVWHRWQQEPARGPWHDWHSLEGPPSLTGSTTVAPTLAPNADGRLELFSVRQGELWHLWQTSPNNGWSGWRSLEHPDGGRLSDATVIADREGRLVALATTGDGLWHRRQQEAGRGPWEPWTPLARPEGGSRIGRPVVRADPAGRLVAFADYLDDQQQRALWLLEQTDPGGDWTGRSLGQQPLPRLQHLIGPLGSPRLALGGNGKLILVFPIAGSTNLYHLGQDDDGERWVVGFERHAPPPRLPPAPVPGG